MNDSTKPGIRTAIEAAWAKLPEIIIAILASLVFVSFSLWLDCRDVRRDLTLVMAEQESERLCQRIGACKSSGESINTFWEIKSELRAVQQKLEERAVRIVTLENQVYELMTNPKARPGAFTSTMGKELEARIRDLEEARQ